MAKKFKYMALLVVLLAVAVSFSGCLGTSKSVSPNEIKQFLQEFEEAFEAKDLSAIIDLHSFPLEVEDDDEVVTMTKEEFTAHIEDLGLEFDEDSEVSATFGPAKIFTASDGTVVVEVTLTIAETIGEESYEESALQKLSLVKVGSKWKLQRPFYLELRFMYL